MGRPNDGRPVQAWDDQELLAEAERIIAIRHATGADPGITELLEGLHAMAARAAGPCETCGGSGECLLNEWQVGGVPERRGPCPDCQPAAAVPHTMPDGTTPEELRAAMEQHERGAQDFLAAAARATGYVSPYLAQAPPAAFPDTPFQRALGTWQGPYTTEVAAGSAEAAAGRVLGGGFDPAPGPDQSVEVRVDLSAAAGAFAGAEEAIRIFNRLADPAYVPPDRLGVPGRQAAGGWRAVVRALFTAPETCPELWARRLELAAAALAGALFGAIVVRLTR